MSVNIGIFAECKDTKPGIKLGENSNITWLPDEDWKAEICEIIIKKKKLNTKFKIYFKPLHFKIFTFLSDQKLYEREKERDLLGNVANILKQIRTH